MPQQPVTFRSSTYRPREQAVREYDEKRGTASSRGYGRRWDRASLAFRRAHPLCLGCEALGRVEASVLTDHIVPHKGDQVLMWDPENFQALCRWHHDVIKQKLEVLFDQGRCKASDLKIDSVLAKSLAESF